MSDLFKIRTAIWLLEGEGIHITALHCQPEVMAGLQGAGLTLPKVLRGDARWLDLPNDPEMGRGIGSSYQETLCGIPIEKRA
jgi:hypothetical protein